MKHTIRILTLLAAMILTAGHVWGTPAINVKVTGGSIEFYSTYSNGALSNQISTAEAGATVYIKATPDALFTPMGMTFNAYASTGSGVAQARTRNGSNTDPGIGQTIEVSPVTGQPGIFTFTMPANGTNVNIDATFAAKTKESVSYIDTDGQTKQIEAYVLDGTEVTLGEKGTTETYTEFWYVCKTDLSYTSLDFSRYCNVNIILADNVEMKVENSTATAINCHGSLGLYGQSTGDTKGALIAKSTYTYGNAINSEGGITISGAKVTATGNGAINIVDGGVSITGSTITANGTSYGISAPNDVTISGSEVTATATATSGYAIHCVGGGVSITDASTVTANGTSYGIGASGNGKDVTISGSEVTATGDQAIYSVGGGVSITDARTVTANGTSYGINANNGVTISGSEVTATGDRAIHCVGGGVSITDAIITANGTSYGINANNGVTISGSKVTATGDQAIHCVGGGVSITDASTVTADGTSNGISASGDVTISGSQVIATSGENGSGIKGYGDIVLGWTNTTDFIMASSYKAGYGKAVTTADGKRFMAYTVDNTNPQSPVETPAAIISGTVSDLTTIAGKMLRPLEDYYVSIPSGLSIVDKTPTFTSGSTSYYKTAENGEVTINVGSYGQKGIELIGTNVPANITFNDDFTQATFTMTAAYVAITDIRYYTTEVAYVDADGNQATTPAAGGETPATKVYILTGSETTIGETGKETWYISNTTGDGLKYSSRITLIGNVHLILADNSTMTVKGEGSFSIYSSGSYYNHDELHIYGQGGTTEGKLTAELESDFAIQCYYTDIFINGGTIIATGKSGIFANSITINGGQLTATSSSTDDAGYGIFASSITLNLSKTTDFVCASSYSYYDNNPFSWQVVEGKVLKYTDDSEQLQLIHSGTLGSEEVAALAGKKITFLGYGGYCGQDNSETTDVDESKNVTWSIPVDDPATKDIDESKTITISGTGYMMYYNSIQNADESWSNGAPWKAFADEIEAVVIKDGITYVGSNTFAHCPNIKSVTLPAEGIYEIGPGAFADCTSLTSIDIPMSVNNIGDGAFAGCSNLATVSIGYGDPGTFTLGSDVFPVTTTILVPESAYENYIKEKAVKESVEIDNPFYGYKDKIVPATRTFFATSTNTWMTWCDVNAWTLPEGCTAYTVSSVSGTTVTLSNALTTIPAYTPVLIQRDANVTAPVTAAFSAVGTVPDSGYDSATGIASTTDTGWAFYGTTTDLATIPEADYSAGLTYVLYGDKFLKSDNNSGIAANRCWLKLEAGGGTSGARLLSIVIDDNPTAIDNVQWSMVNGQSDSWYTIDGRKLNGKPTKKGLYIYNGKKVAIK